MTTKPGAFITFEGGEGAGKSTQIGLLAQSLRQYVSGVHITREPGGAPGAEAIRELLVKGDAARWHKTTEAMLFAAARHDHVQHTIKPQLAQGTWVVSDRFLDSTRVYQGIGKDLGVEYINQLHRLSVGDFYPDLVLVLDIDPKIGLKRALARKGDETRFESLPLDFHKRVRQGFLDLAKQNEGRYSVISADADIKAVHQRVIDAVNLRFGLLLAPSQ